MAVTADSAPCLDPHPGAASAPSLTALMVGVAVGDHGSFEAIYPGLARVAYGVALAVLRDPAQAEEVAQEVLLEVWSLAARFDALRGTPQALVATLAHRRAVDRVRSVAASNRRQRRSEAPAAHPDPVPAVAVAHPEARLVLGALADLPAAQRTAIELAYFDGLTYREVSQRLGILSSTAKIRIRDGLIRLHAVLTVPPQS